MSQISGVARYLEISCYPSGREEEKIQTNQTQKFLILKTPNPESSGVF